MAAMLSVVHGFEHQSYVPKAISCGYVEALQLSVEDVTAVRLQPYLTDNFMRYASLFRLAKPDTLDIHHPSIIVFIGAERRP